jgi:hypothetical protein
VNRTRVSGVSGESDLDGSSRNKSDPVGFCRRCGEELSRNKTEQVGSGCSNVARVVREALELLEGGRAGEAAELLRGAICERCPPA